LTLGSEAAVLARFGRIDERRSTAVLELRSEDKQTASQAFDQQLIMRLLCESVRSTEATSDQPASVSSDRRAQDTQGRLVSR
jgi:hypothetical protein